MDKVILIGYVGSDPEGGYTQNGNFVAHFSVASHRRKDAPPVWYRISAWGDLGETCHKYLSKGRRVYVEGRLEYDEKSGGPRTFVRKDSTVGTAFDVTATLVEFLDSREREGEDEGA